MKNFAYVLVVLFLSSCKPPLVTQIPSASPVPSSGPILSQEAPLNVGTTRTGLDLRGKVLIETSDAVYLAKPDGSSPVLIYAINSPIPMMSLSPDGTRFAYFQDNYLYVEDVETKSVKRLNQDEIGSAGGQLKWSSDGRKIALSCSTLSEPSGSICLVDVDSGQIDILVREKDLMRNHSLYSIYYIDLNDWSRDGSDIIFTSYTPSEKGQKEDFAIYLYNTSTSAVQMLLDGNKQDTIQQFRGAAISPDRTMLLISGTGADPSFRMFRLDLQGSRLIQLTTPENYSYSAPVWGSDSSYFYVHLEQNSFPLKESTAILDTYGGILSFLDIQGAVVEWVR